MLLFWIRGYDRTSTHEGRWEGGGTSGIAAASLSFDWIVATLEQMSGSSCALNNNNRTRAVITLNNFIGGCAGCTLPWLARVGHADLHDVLLKHWCESNVACMRFDRT